MGWDLSLLGLAFCLIAGTGKPEDENEFVTTEAARQFIRTSSRLWGEASASAVTDEEQAMAVAERTAGFFLGQPPTE